MPQWKSVANTTGAPKWGATIFIQGSGPANVASNNAALVVNTTPGALLGPQNANNTAVQNIAVGVFPVTPYAKANTSGESGKVHGLGWAARRAWEGPITTIGQTANGSGFANGETVTVSGGSANATISITSNLTGNIASATVGAGLGGGAFPNTSVLSTSFTREKHVANVAFTGTNATFETAAVTITVSNSNLSYGVNAVATATTNSTGGITANVVFTGTTGLNPGLFGNTQLGTNLVVTVALTSNGEVIGGLTPTVNLGTSTGGNVGTFTLGGRAGRVSYEMLVIDRHIANGTASNTTQLPQ